MMKCKKNAMFHLAQPIAFRNIGASKGNINRRAATETAAKLNGDEVNVCGCGLSQAVAATAKTRSY